MNAISNLAQFGLKVVAPTLLIVLRINEHANFPVN